ncbi:hypothetical protein [Streptomyces sp. NPDC056291]|uniref:hypothetical protein n=1 Tax=Streptomyces sp. NPDC056291 TaxID=3345772 RepID=UPI0035DCAA2D
MKNLPAPSSSTVVIARVLRGLGLTQGCGGDFRVAGEYRSGERIGTYVLPLSRHADEVIAEYADEIERLADETGYTFRVSVRYHGDRQPPWPTTARAYSRPRPSRPPPRSPRRPRPRPALAEPAPESHPADPVAARFLEGARERALSCGRGAIRSGAVWKAWAPGRDVWVSGSRGSRAACCY